MVASPIETNADGVPEEAEAILAQIERVEPEPAAPLAKPIPTPNVQDLNIEHIKRIAHLMVQTKAFSDVQSVGQAFLKVLAGQELGLGAFASMNGLYVVQGKVVLATQTMAALLKRGGKYTYRVKEWDRRHCVLDFYERDGRKWELIGTTSFSVEDAKAAGIYRQGRNGPSTWEAHSDIMCMARALSRGARWLCPDAIAAPAYVPEELDQSDEGGGE